jgi:hypothetical protein
MTPRIQETRPSRIARLLSVFALLVLAGTPGLRAAISVTDPTATSFNALNTYAPNDPNYTAGTNWLTDPTGDQSTGQKADDFVAFSTTTANSGGATISASFFLQTDGTTMIFRTYLQTLQTQKGSPSYGGYFRIGVDANGDGSADIYMGVDAAGGAQGITYMNPTAGYDQLTPNTSKLGNPYGLVAFSATNYNYASDGGTGAMLTFATPFATLQSNLSALGITIDANTPLRYVAFTATNSNTVNQDVLGIGALSTFGTTRYDAGIFSDYYTPSGVRTPVPEPATVAQTMVLVGAPGLLWWRRCLRRRNAPPDAA